jgi:oligosaccharide repeat unit polymerase
MQRLIYIPLLVMLLWIFWRVIRKIGGCDAALTPILGWTVGLAFFFLVPLTLMVLHGGYQDPAFYAASASHNSVDLSSTEFFVPFLLICTSLLFSAGVLLFFLPKAPPKIESARNRPELVLDRALLKKVIFVTTILALLDYGFTIRMVGGFEQFLLSNWSGRVSDLLADMGDRYALYLWISQANQIVFTAAAVLYTHSEAQEGKIHWGISALLLLVFLLHSAFQGERIYLALYLLSALTSCWLYRRKKLVAGLLLAAPVLAAVFSAWAYFRNDLSKLSDNVSVYNDADMQNRTMTWFMDACDGDDVMFLFHVIQDFGARHEYLYGTSYARAVYFVIPRRVFPEKPHGFNLQLAEIYEPGSATSFAATQLGELYANFGPASILLLPALTLAILLLSNHLRKGAQRNPLIFTELFLLLIWAARSTLEDQFITFVFALLLTRGLRLERGWGRRSSRAIAPLPVISS